MKAFISLELPEILSRSVPVAMVVRILSSAFFNADSTPFRPSFLLGAHTNGIEGLLVQQLSSIAVSPVFEKILITKSAICISTFRLDDVRLKTDMFLLCVRNPPRMEPRSFASDDLDIYHAVTFDG